MSTQSNELLSSDLNNKSMGELAAIFNALSTDRKVKKFSDKKTGIRRVTQLREKVIAEGVPEKKGSPAKGRNLGIGVRMVELLKDGKDTAEILKTIHAEFPLSRATGKDVSLIRRKHDL